MLAAGSTVHQLSCSLSPDNAGILNLTADFLEQLECGTGDDSEHCDSFDRQSFAAVLAAALTHQPIEFGEERQEELKSALNFAQIDPDSSDCVINWDQLPARGVVPEYGGGLGFAMRNLPGIVNDT